MNAPPVVGVTTYREEAAWGVWRQPADLLPAPYADAIARAGGIPVLLPPADGGSGAGGLEARALRVAARLDALVLAGGADVDPARYGATPHPRTLLWRPDRDAWELAMVAAAEALALPTLGVCRGMQLLAVAAGGSLHQHTPDLVGHEQHGPTGPEFGRVGVLTAAGSLTAAVVGPTAIVPCHHHQSVRAHPGFTATAWASDGTVEAMEADGDRFCLAVQWHPEMDRDQRLFDALVVAARRAAAGPRPATHAPAGSEPRAGSRPGQH